MRLLFTVTFLICHQCFFGQNILAAKIAGGVSDITSNNFSNVTKTSTFFQPSGQAGFCYTYRVKNRFNFGGELLFSQIEGKERLETPATDTYGNLTGDLIIDNITKRISYLTIPLIAGISFKKINFSIGFQTSFVLANSAHEYGEFTSNGITTIWDKIGKLNIDKYDYGIRVGMGYEINKRMVVEANYYYGLNNIVSNTVTITNLKWTVQQIVLGVRYNLFVSKDRVPEK